MRRTILVVIATALVTSAVTSVTVAAATGSGERVAAPVERDEALGARLPVIVDTKVDCGTPPKGRDWPDQDALEDTIRCLEDELVNVNRFMKVFFRCARIVEITQYGENPAGGTHGYVYGFPDGTAFLTTALDFTFDPTVESFVFMMLWRDSTFCLT
jgi:hypothetical protein